jgi:probable selenium-dependent hydroxylase accessory protein YqeC
MLESLQDLVIRWFTAGGIHALVGAGGKSTGMRTAGRVLAARGLRVRMTTTTRIGHEEFAAHPLFIADSEGSLARALAAPDPAAVIAGSVLPEGKLGAVDPAWLDRAHVPADVVLIAECDGSRRLPLKVPTEREPVIPECARSVYLLMGAGAFGRPIGPDTCYNSEGAWEILGFNGGVFDARALAVLATHPRGGRKAVPPGAGFFLIINQADLAGSRELTLDLFRELCLRNGPAAVSLSWLEEKVYAVSGEAAC